MTTLYILYDASCGLCSHIVQWMSTQPASVALQFIVSGSDAAHRLFPTLRTSASELVAVSDTGDVYRGDAAFIVCLYALDDYRRLSFRLARPALRPLAKRAFGILSANRKKVSELLGLENDADLATSLADSPGFPW
jgi:predicted DCC family thiol-disulfide oxidoreductase YuxK